MSLPSTAKSRLACLGTAVALAVTGCVSSTPPPESEGYEPHDGDFESIVAELVVCDLVDWERLAALTGWEVWEGPEELEPGGGDDPNSSQCDLRYAADEKVYADFTVAVVPFDDEAEAGDYLDLSVDALLAQYPDATADDLEGGWDRGRLVVGGDDVDHLTLAMAARNQWMMKVELTTSTQDMEDGGLPATAEELEKLVSDVAAEFYVAADGML